MKLRHHDLHIPNDGSDPFVNCKLDRQKYSGILTDIIDGYADGFVLAINNPWGEGKTTFVKMWRQHLINEGFPTLYFNAWENDFQEDVLVALISELSELDNKPERQFKDVLKKVLPLTGKILPSVIKHLIKRYGGDDAAQDIAEAFGGYTEDQLVELTDSYKEKKESIKQFRSSLEVFASEAGGDKPLVFIIDELDRCRPSYAVEVLEQIKHLFSVSGIVFVLAIDKEQLGHAIRGVYGSDKINADEYLRRFFDLEYAIPSPDYELFINHLYDYFDFQEFIKSPSRPQTGEFQNDESTFKETMKIFFSSQDFTLRQIERVMSRIRVVLRSFGPGQYIFSETLVFLSYLSLKHTEVFEKIKNYDYSVGELAEVLDGILKSFFGKGRNERRLLLLFASILTKYNMDLFHPEKGNRGIVLIDTSEGEAKPAIASELDKEGDLLLRALQFQHQHFDTSSIELSFIIEKYQLTEPLRS